MSERKNLLGPFEWFALLVGLAILIYIGLQKGGCKPIERSVEVTFVDPSKTANPRPTRRGPSESEQKAERMLQQMAQQFEAAEGAQANSTLPSNDWGLTEDEAAFYQKIRDTYQVDNRIQSARDWLNVLRTSQRTYRQVEQLFAELSPQQSNQTSPREVLANEAASKDLYSRLKDWYDLSTKEIDAFVQNGEPTLADWALFLAKSEGNKN